MLTAVRMVPMILVMGTIFYFSHQPADSLDLPLFPHADKLIHAIIYGFLAGTVIYALLPHSSGWRPVSFFLVVMLVCLSYGVLDEFHQRFIPGRDPDILDIVADGVGSLIVCCIWFFTQAKASEQTGSR